LGVPLILPYCAIVGHKVFASPFVSTAGALKNIPAPRVAVCDASGEDFANFDLKRE